MGRLSKKFEIFNIRSDPNFSDIQNSRFGKVPRHEGQIRPYLNPNYEYFEYLEYIRNWKFPFATLLSFKFGTLLSLCHPKVEVKKIDCEFDLSVENIKRSEYIRDIRNIRSSGSNRVR